MTSTLLVCGTCLRASTQTRPVETLGDAYEFLVGAPPGSCLRLCGQCSALLCKSVGFKLQALQAQTIMEAPGTLKDITNFQRYLSLEQTTKQTYDNVFIHVDTTSESLCVEVHVEDGSTEVNGNIYRAVSRMLRSEEPGYSKIILTQSDGEDEVVVEAGDLRLKFNVLSGKYDFRKLCGQEKKPGANSLLRTVHSCDEQIDKFVVLGNAAYNPSIPIALSDTDEECFHNADETIGFVAKKRRKRTKERRIRETCIKKKKQNQFVELNDVTASMTDMVRRPTLFLAERLEEFIAAGKVERFTGSLQDLKRYRLLETRRVISAVRHKCRMCIVGWHSQENLLKHMEQYHYESAGTLSCHICSRRFASEEDLGAHRDSHFELLRCMHHECLYVTSSIRKMALHAPKHKADKEHDLMIGGFKDLKADEMTCNICGIEYKNRSYYLLHRSQQHTSTKRYECDQCGKTYNHRYYMVRHLKTHTRNFVCEMCGHVSKQLTGLKNHMLSHLDYEQRPYQCTECQKYFINKTKLRLHTLIHTREIVMCAYCGHNFTDIAQLNRHLKGKHPDKFIEKSNKRMKEIQPRTKSSYRNAQTKVHYEYKFTSMPRDKNQMLVACSICGREFKSQRQLQMHSFVHTDVRPHQCDQCEKTFKTKMSLYNHKVTHRKEFRHQCAYCDKRFRVKTDMRKHELVHTGEMKYVCNVCEMPVSCAGSLTRHMKRHAPAAADQRERDSEPKKLLTETEDGTENTWDEVEATTKDAPSPGLSMILI